jgi:hypothetical protein
MLVPLYTITFQPSSSGTILVGQHPSPAHSGTSGVHVGSYDPVLKTYQSLGGPDRVSPPRVNQHPVPRWHLHPRASSHKDTPPQDLLTSTCHRDLSRGMPRSHPSSKTCPKDSSYDPVQSTQPSPHIQDTWQDLPGCYPIIGTKCLNHSQTIIHHASHHRYNA